jgi:hypothetical protein
VKKPQTMSKAQKKSENDQSLKEYFQTMIKPILEEHEKTLDEHTDYFVATEQMLVNLKEQLTQLQSNVSTLEATVSVLKNASVSSEKQKKRSAPQEEKEEAPQNAPKIAKKPVSEENKGTNCRLCSGLLNGNPKKHYCTTKHLSKLASSPVYCSLECTRKSRQEWSDSLPDEPPVFDGTIHARTNVGVICTVCGGLVQPNQD